MTLLLFLMMTSGHIWVEEQGEADLIQQRQGCEDHGSTKASGCAGNVD